MKTTRVYISILKSEYCKQKFPNSFFQWPFGDKARTSQDEESSIILFQSL